MSFQSGMEGSDPTCAVPSLPWPGLAPSSVRDRLVFGLRRISSMLAGSPEVPAVTVAWGAVSPPVAGAEPPPATVNRTGAVVVMVADGPDVPPDPDPALVAGGAGGGSAAFGTTMR